MTKTKKGVKIGQVPLRFSEEETEAALKLIDEFLTRNPEKAKELKLTPRKPKNQG
jgi:hypothetical protein